MSDAYLLLTPLLMLAVVALVGFVGCDLLFGLDTVPPYVPPPPGPANLTGIPGDNRVDLMWDDFPMGTQFYVKRRTGSDQYVDVGALIPAGSTTFADTTVINGTPYSYVVTARLADDQETLPSNPFDTTPGVEALISLVTSKTLGSLRNFGGWVGMGVQVGSRALTVQKLGRIFAPGNTGTHAAKIVDGVTKADVPGGGVMIAVNTGTLNEFVYVDLAAPITLNANTDYYVISQEPAVGDQFYDSVDTSVTTTPVAVRVYAVNGDGAGNYNVAPLDAFVYGPVDFQYSLQ
jgi:hypothetical protein